jgi:hypothetical protein
VSAPLCSSVEVLYLELAFLINRLGYLTNGRGVAFGNLDRLPLPFSATMSHLQVTVLGLVQHVPSGGAVAPYSAAANGRLLGVVELLLSFSVFAKHHAIVSSLSSIAFSAIGLTSLLPGQRRDVLSDSQGLHRFLALGKRGLALCPA